MQIEPWIQRKVLAQILERAKQDVGTALVVPHTIDTGPSLALTRGNVRVSLTLSPFPPPLDSELSPDHLTNCDGVLLKQADASFDYRKMKGLTSSPRMNPGASAPQDLVWAF